MCPFGHRRAAAQCLLSGASRAWENNWDMDNKTQDARTTRAGTRPRGAWCTNAP